MMEEGGVREAKEGLGEAFGASFLKDLARDGESNGDAKRLRRRAGVVLGVGKKWAICLV